MRIERFVFLLAAACVLAAPPVEISPQRYKETVHLLASPEMKGRGTGSPELEKAAESIAGEFKRLGLQPVRDGSFFQRYDVTTDAKPGLKNSFIVHRAGAQTTLTMETDYTPMNFSAAGAISGSLVFAGYGITAPEYNYDDYAGIDVKDRIVVVLRSEPQEYDDKSVFAGKVYTQHSQLESKAVNARFHGAKALLFVNNQLSDSAAVPKFSRNVGSGFRAVPFVQVKADLVNEWLAPTGKNLRELMDGIDRDLNPRSFALPSDLTVELSVDIDRTVKKVPNVVGYLPGETDEYIILGAHYDHLGLGEQFSMSPSQAGQVHPGADDNASGTAGVLELARYFAAQPKRKRGILFLTFSGEELGLLGSSFYVNNPWLPMNKAVVMINMDMIGRIRDGKVYVSGVGTGSTLKAVLESEKDKFNLKLDFSEQGGYGSSDHTSFTIKQVPILFFFSGLHADYHRPSDTWDKIEAEPAAELLRLVADITTHLQSDTDRPLFVKIAPPATPQAAPGSGSGSGYGPDFGSIPDFSEVPNGFRIADVRPGGPAARAGVQGGDIMFEFDGKPIASLMDFTYALRSKKPGDEVLVKVRRNNEIKEIKVTLGTRNR